MEPAPEIARLRRRAIAVDDRVMRCAEVHLDWLGLDDQGAPLDRGRVAARIVARRLSHGRPTLGAETDGSRRDVERDPERRQLDNRTVHQRVAPARDGSSEDFLYDSKGGSLRSPPSADCGRPQAAVLAGAHAHRGPQRPERQEYAPAVLSASCASADSRERRAPTILPRWPATGRRWTRGRAASVEAAFRWRLARQAALRHGGACAPPC